MIAGILAVPGIAFADAASDNELSAVDTSGDETPAMDLDLAGTVRMALSRNYGLQNDVLDRRIAESNHRSTLSEYWPTLTLQSDSTFDDPGEAVSAAPADTALDHQFQVSLDKRFAATGASISLYSTLDRFDASNLDTGGLDSEFEAPYDTGLETARFANTLGIRIDQPLLRNLGPWSDGTTLTQAKVTLENAFFDYDLSVRRFVLETISAYFNALKQLKLVEVAEKSVEDAQRHLDFTRIKFEEGLVAQMDVSQAELQLARQQTSLIRVEQSAQAALDALKVRLSLPLSVTLTLTQPVNQTTETLDDQSLIREGLAQRLEIRRLNNRIRSAEMEIARAMNQRLPDLDLVLSAEVTQRDNHLDRVFEIDDQGYAVSLGFSWTIGNAALRETWRRERMRRMQLENELKRETLDIEKEIRDEIRNYRSLAETLRVSSRSVDVAETALQLATQSYQEGLTTNLDLIKAQDDLLEARNRYFSDVLDLAVAKARIIHALGREIDPENLEINNHE